MNPLFKQHLSDLFDKLATLQQPMQVAEDLRAAGRHGLPGQIERGQSIIDFATSGAKGLARAGTGGGDLAARLMAPAVSEGRALAHELGRAGTYLSHPARLPVTVGGLVMAPILADAFHGNQQRREDELMNLQMNPMHKLSHLEAFLEKKAAARSRMPSTPQTPPKTLGNLHTSIGGHLHDSFAGGVGQGIGGGIANAIIGVLGGGFQSLHNSLIVDPKRKALFESVIRSDPVIHDAITRMPDADKTLAEAFQTMVRFAPSLSLDVNAVRSFLREAVVGGAAGVNYATIKTLIETEKGLHSSGGNR